MNATYYDGKTSRPHDAQVSIFGNTLTIDYQGIEKIQQEIWNISAIDYSSFTGKGKTMLKYGDFPHQHLEFPIDSTLHQTLESYLPKRRQGFWAFSNELANSGFRGVAVASVIFVAVAVGFYFWVLPNIAEYVATKVPIKTEVKLGEELYKGMMKDYEIDKEKTKQLNAFAKKMNFNTNYPLKFTVIDDKMVNAFALPGGNVVVFNGILKKMDKSEELAALLSHEVSHVKERHSLKGMARDLAGTTVISVITGDASTIGSVLIEQADTFNGLKFSRNLERDADLKGLDIMYLNKLDPQGMVRLMESLQEEEDKMLGKDTEKDKKEGKNANDEKNTADKILSYVSTHPLTKDRISYIKAEIKGKTGIRNEDLEKIWLELKKK
jgi:beta-barrel assembly-enhancing protease